MRRYSPSILAPNGVKWIARQQNEPFEARYLAVTVTSTYAGCGKIIG
jgi:hypothetical protein